MLSPQDIEAIAQRVAELLHDPSPESVRFVDAVEDVLHVDVERPLRALRERLEEPADPVMAGVVARERVAAGMRKVMPSEKDGADAHPDSAHTAPTATAPRRR